MIMNTLNYKLLGLNCDACVKISTMKLKNVPGVHDVKIDSTSGKTEICAERHIELEELNESLRGTDFTLTK